MTGYDKKKKEKKNFKGKTKEITKKKEMIFCYHKLNKPHKNLWHRGYLLQWKRDNNNKKQPPLGCEVSYTMKEVFKVNDMDLRQKKLENYLKILKIRIVWRQKIIEIIE